MPKLAALTTLIAAGTGIAYARVQRPNYADLVYKGGRVEIEGSGNTFFARYKSPEGFGHIVCALHGESEAEAYMLKIANAGRWHYQPPDDGS